MEILFKESIAGCDRRQIKNFIDDIITNINMWRDLNENDEFEFRLILNELIANGTFHGNKGLCTKRVTATLQAIDNNTINIIIQDEGSGFDYSDIFDGLYPCDANPLAERGRGLKLIRALCNDIRFNTQGNMIKIKKSICSN